MTLGAHKDPTVNAKDDWKESAESGIHSPRTSLLVTPEIRLLSGSYAGRRDTEEGYGTRRKRLQHNLPEGRVRPL